MLDRLGFGVTRHLARVQMGSNDIRPRTHMCLVVETDGHSYLADVAFGGQTLRFPMPLRETTVDQEGTPHRLRSADEVWRLQTRGDDGSFDVYRFAEERHHQVDIERANHYTANHPRHRSSTNSSRSTAATPTGPAWSTPT